MGISAVTAVTTYAARKPPHQTQGSFQWGERIDREILPILPAGLRAALVPVCQSRDADLEEIRLRVGRPVILVLREGEAFLAGNGGEPRIFTQEEAASFLELISRSSLYAYAEELRGGFLTVPGGHRVGFAGRAVVEGGKLRTLRDLSAYNVRIARELKGAADPVIPNLILPGGRLGHALIISPPGVGKTTLLRDMVRQISDGIPRLGIPGRQVAVVDERSEIAGSYFGIPQNDVGLRTDVLDGCSKAEGIFMLLRSMAPRLIATDEIGGAADAQAVEEAVNTGVTVLATAHGNDPRDLERRPALRSLLEKGCFDRLVVLKKGERGRRVFEFYEMPGETGGYRLLGAQ